MLYRHRNNDPIYRHAAKPNYDAFGPDEAEGHIDTLANHLKAMHDAGQVDVHRALAESMLYDRMTGYDGAGRDLRDKIHGMIRKRRGNT